MSIPGTALPSLPVFSIGRKLQALDDIKAMLAGHVVRATEKLRRQGSITRGLIVFLHTNLFSEHDAAYRNSLYLPLPMATDDTRILLRYALAGPARIYQDGFRYQKTGVILLDMLPNTVRQGHLFEAEEVERARRLLATVNAINARLGRNTVRCACQGFQPAGLMRMERRTPAYTIRWEALPVVKAGW